MVYPWRLLEQGPSSVHTHNIVSLSAHLTQLSLAVLILANTAPPPSEDEPLWQQFNQMRQLSFIQKTLARIPLTVQ